MTQALHLMAADITYSMAFVSKVATESGLLSAGLFRTMGFFPALVIETAIEIVTPVTGYFIVRFVLNKYPQYQAELTRILVIMYFAILSISLVDLVGDLLLPTLLK